MPNYRMAKPGHSFTEEGVNLSWGVGREQSDVISLPLDQQSYRFKQRVLSGVIIETDEPPTAPTGISDIREYRLLTGDEARALKAEPAGPVTRSVYNPMTGVLEEVPLATPRVSTAEPAGDENVDEGEEGDEAAVADESPEPDIVPDDPAEATAEDEQ